MYPIPGAAMTGVFEMVCYFFTVASAVIGYLLTVR